MSAETPTAQATPARADAAPAASLEIPDNLKFMFLAARLTRRRPADDSARSYLNLSGQNAAGRAPPTSLRRASAF